MRSRHWIWGMAALVSSSGVALSQQPMPGHTVPDHIMDAMLHWF